MKQLRYKKIRVLIYLYILKTAIDYLQISAAVFGIQAIQSY